MPHLPPNPPAGFDDLSPAEQIDYVQALWDRIAARESEVPVPAWHATEIDRRMSDYEGRPWDEIEAELRARLADR